MGFETYGRRGRNDEYECNTCQAVVSGDSCGTDNDCHQHGGRSGYREWKNEAVYTAGSDCGCETPRCPASQNEYSECIDGETHIYFESCEGVKEITMFSECHNEDSLGRVLDVNMTLRNMCPGRRCAVGVHLTEMDESGTEYTRGFRAITVPAHNHSQNRDVALPSVRFILPEDVSAASGSCRRHFVVRATNHYMDEADCSCWNKR